MWKVGVGKVLELIEQKKRKFSWIQLRVEKKIAKLEILLYNQIPIQETKTRVWKKTNFPTILSKEILVWIVLGHVALS